VTIRIEADLSPEQLLSAVEQLPPPEFATFFAELLERARRESGRAQLPPHADAGSGGATQHPYLAAAGMFADDSFAAEVDAYISAERARERAQAAGA
jgi:hypothetical protein